MTDGRGGDVVTRLFVYGTLMRGEPAHALLERAQMLGGVSTEMGYALFDMGAFPAMVASGLTSVLGEVYTVSADLLAAVDRYEGCPEFYRRRQVTLSDGSKAETYVLTAAQVQGCDEVDGGDWRRR
jgi:gamma-glutamylcyclotransferase (GGCT)/AIG2-like uncharacterized protein YtfP